MEYSLLSSRYKLLSNEISANSLSWRHQGLGLKDYQTHWWYLYSFLLALQGMVLTSPQCDNCSVLHWLWLTVVKVHRDYRFETGIILIGELVTKSSRFGWTVTGHRYCSSYASYKVILNNYVEHCLSWKKGGGDQGVQLGVYRIQIMVFGYEWEIVIYTL